MKNDELTEIDKHLIRFKIISYSIDLLLDVCIMSNHKHGGTVAFKYGLIEFANFIDYYSSFFKCIDRKKKELVLCLSPLLKVIFENEKYIIRTRNNWVGHLKDKGNFLEEEDPTNKDRIHYDTYLKMSHGVTRFYHGITKIFFEEHERLKNNLFKPEEEIFVNEKINLPLFQQEMRNLMKVVNRKLELNNAGFQLSIQ